MKAEEIDKLFSSFSSQNVLVIGDVMVDAYLWGRVDRISPEAPVPVINIQKSENRLGGSANVALNLLGLKAQPIICSVIGKDRMGEELMGLMKSLGMKTDGIIQSKDRITTVKTRIISQHQQMLRMDEEITEDLSVADENSLMNVISQILNNQKISVVIFEDYNKGVITKNIIDKTIAICKSKNIATCVDPKKNHFFEYKDVTLFKPNLKELREGLKMDIDVKENGSLTGAVNKLHEILNHEISLITLSERGVFVRFGKEEKSFAAHQRNITDVSGAGDTVIAVASLCVALKSDSSFMAQLSNLAGGLVCEQTGVVPINFEHLLSEAKIKLVTN